MHMYLRSYVHMYICTYAHDVCILLDHARKMAHSEADFNRVVKLLYTFHYGCLKKRRRALFSEDYLALSARPSQER